MMVFWRAGIAFLAVPKTGTHAYQAALADSADIILRGPPGAKHMNARKFNRHMRPILGKEDAKKLKTIAVIRDPIDWLGSWYRYRSRPQLDGLPNSTANVSFDTFVQDYLSDDPPAYARLGSQLRFVGDSEGNVIVDRLFDYARLSQLDRFLEKKLERKIIAPRLNESPQGDLQISAKVEAKLREERSKEFELYQSVAG